jgi:hypothetical protein
MAERAARSAERAAASARMVANRAADFARETRSKRLQDAADAVATTRTEEAAARDAYHASEREAHARHNDGTEG